MLKNTGGNNLTKILLSIRPEYVDKILCGTKKYEYRKRLSTKKVDSIIVYVTAPQKRIVAEIEVLSTIGDSPTSLWEKTKNDAGISRTKFHEYFKNSKNAYAYKLGRINVFEPAKYLKDYGIMNPPQSFIYIDEKHPI